MKSKEEIDTDNPPWTTEMWAAARPLREVDPELAEWSRQRKEQQNDVGVSGKTDTLVKITVDIFASDMPKFQKRPEELGNQIRDFAHRLVDA